MNKLLISLLTVTLGYLMVFAIQVSALSVEQSEPGETVVIYGGALIEDAQAQYATKRLLDAEDVENVDFVYGSDVAKYIRENYDTNALRSSVKITPQPEGSGLSIQLNEEIGKITEVRPFAYENALLTAGVYDADVVIAASSDVTGESALTGIYKAYEVTGHTVDTDATYAAQDELDAITTIEDNHEENENFSSEELNHVVIEVKVDIADHYIDEDALNISESEVRDVIEDKLEENDLHDVLNENEKERLTSTIYESVQQETFLEDGGARLKNAGQNLSERIQSSDAFEQAKERAGDIDRNAIQRFFDSIFNFFKNLFN